MLNVKGLTELLTQNRDDKLCKRWWLMTPNGTLLAYSQPANTRDLRNQAAMVALSWQEHEIAKVHEEHDEDDEDHDPAEFMDRVRALTIEGETGNVIATRLQPHMLLVLEGGVPPRRKDFEPKTTVESIDDDGTGCGSDQHGDIRGLSLLWEEGARLVRLYGGTVDRCDRGHGILGHRQVHICPRKDGGVRNDLFCIVTVVRILFIRCAAIAALERLRGASLDLLDHLSKSASSLWV